MNLNPPWSPHLRKTIPLARWVRSGFPRKTTMGNRIINGWLANSALASRIHPSSKSKISITVNKSQPCHSEAKGLTSKRIMPQRRFLITCVTRSIWTLRTIKTPLSASMRFRWHSRSEKWCNSNSNSSQEMSRLLNSLKFMQVSKRNVARTLLATLLII